jgi:hypothetical protein
MRIKIQLAEHPEQILAAHNLVRKVYKKCFNGLDVNQLKSPKFRQEVLIAVSAESNEILGTLSFMYPSENTFPCESSFGFVLSETLKKKQGYLEIGRFATTDECKKHLTVVISLFLGIAYFLEKRQMNGWIATIKDHIFDFFKKIDLPMNCIEQSPNLPPDSLMWKYIEDPRTLHLFEIGAEKSIDVFKQKFQRYIINGSIEIDL